MNVTTIKETNKLDYSAREAFKFLRTNFLFCGNEYKTILITNFNLNKKIRIMNIYRKIFSIS